MFGILSLFCVCIFYIFLVCSYFEVYEVYVYQFSSVQSLSRVWLWPHESQHARTPCSSPTPGVHSNSCPSSRWCHPVISSSVVPFSSCPQSLPASGSFPMSQLFTWGGQSSGVSALASFLPVILEPPKIKSDTVSIVSLSIFHEVMGPDDMILVFWMLSLSFKPTFSLSSRGFLVPLHFLP